MRYRKKELYESNNESGSYLTSKEIFNIKWALSFMPETPSTLFYRDIFDKLYDRAKPNNVIYLDEEIDESSHGMFFVGTLSRLLEDIMDACESFEDRIAKARKLLNKEISVDL